MICHHSEFIFTCESVSAETLVVKETGRHSNRGSDRVHSHTRLSHSAKIINTLVKQ